MKSTREKILLTLLKKPQSTVSALAEAVKINNISVRHHLSNLLAENLIIAEEERHGVGRPRLVYSLTNEGIEKFPTRYWRLTNRILKRVRNELTPQQVKDLFSSIAYDVASDHKKNVSNLSFEEKINYIDQLLSEEGFEVEVEKADSHYILHEINCPYIQVVQNHPEVCAFDQVLISELLSIPIERINCIASGAKQCSYIIPFNKSMEIV
ncbi:MAG: hypothetical protein BGO78_16185 [Chloroflexi bacterium 44-23]|nr:MAG: hypothetical protein BGO78_16185 [Chloroflexi bacterium 44-23]